MTKITDFAALTGVGVDAANDLVTVVDVSETGAARNKKMTFAEFFAFLADTDGTLAANSDAKFATQKAVKTYVATAVTGLLDLKGSTDCSANPNYPAASKGDTYIVSVAGKIGGASGTVVEVGDVYIASADNAGGTQASVGSSWLVVQGNMLSGVAGASTTQTGEQISGFIASPSNKSYTIALDMKHAGTITEVTTKSASGTCTATWKINSTALGGTANSVSSTETTQSHASANVFAAGDDVVLTVSSNSSCADMSFTIKYTRTLS